jgi:hypothetical protein
MPECTKMMQGHLFDLSIDVYFGHSLGGSGTLVSM